MTTDLLVVIAFGEQDPHLYKALSNSIVINGAQVQSTFPLYHKDFLAPSQFT